LQDWWSVVLAAGLGGTGRGVSHAGLPRHGQAARRPL